MLCHLLLRHVTDEFINIVILNLLFFSSHDILHILVHHIHSFLFSHELLHGLVVIGVLHLVVSPTHYFSHPWHHILHRLVHTHLLQSNSKKNVLEGDCLQLGIKIIVFLNHLIVFKYLLSDNFLSLLDYTMFTAGYFFYIFFFKSFWSCFPWY